MNEDTAVHTYTRHRFPPAIIGHAVWLYFHFALRYRDVEELLAERGVIVTYEMARQWCRKFGQVYANGLRRRRPRPGDKWHLDEVCITINGQQHYLWRAVDQAGNGLAILVRSRRDKQAATRFFRTLLKRLAYVPRVVIIDKLPSYGAAKREVLSSVAHRQHKRRNNRAENSTSSRASGSDGCGASRVRAMRNASSPPTARSPATSARAATASPPSPTARPETSVSPRCGRSPAPQRWPERRRPLASPRFQAPASRLPQL